MSFIDELAVELENFIEQRWDKSLITIENHPAFLAAEEELRGMVDEKAFEKFIEVYADLSKVIFRKGFIEGLITTSAMTKLFANAKESQPLSS